MQIQLVSRIEYLLLQISLFDLNNILVLGNTSSHNDRVENTNTDDTTAAQSLQTREVAEQEYDQLATQSTSVNANDQNVIKPLSDNVPMETESSQVQAPETSTESISNNDKIKHGNVWNKRRNLNETSCTNINNKPENMMENLQDRLTTMRDGFLER